MLSPIPIDFERKSPVELKRSGKGDIDSEKRRLRKAAKEMESLFLFQMLKAMRKSIPEADKDNSLGLGGGMGKSTYIQMFDQELALKMSGIGEKSIAESIYRSMEKVLERQNGIENGEKIEIDKLLPTQRHIKISAQYSSALNPANSKTASDRNGTLIPEYKKIIREAADKFNLNPLLINSIIRAESNGNPRAVSPAGAKGLMQLIDTTAADMGVTDVFDPEQNIKAGAGYLRQMIDRFGDLKKALAAYNAGPETVKRYGGVPPYHETQKYVKQILKLSAINQ